MSLFNRSSLVVLGAGVQGRVLHQEFESMERR